MQEKIILLTGAKDGLGLVLTQALVDAGSRHRPIRLTRLKYLLPTSVQSLRSVDVTGEIFLYSKNIKGQMPDPKLR